MTSGVGVLTHSHSETVKPCISIYLYLYPYPYLYLTPGYAYVLNVYARAHTYTIIRYDIEGDEKRDETKRNETTKRGENDSEEEKTTTDDIDLRNNFNEKKHEIAHTTTTAIAECEAKRYRVSKGAQAEAT